MLLFIIFAILISEEKVYKIILLIIFVILGALIFFITPKSKYAADISRFSRPENKIAKIIAWSSTVIVISAAIMKILHINYSNYVLILGFVLFLVASLIEIENMEKKLRLCSYFNLAGIITLLASMSFRKYDIFLFSCMFLGLILLFLSRFYYDIFRENE